MVDKNLVLPDESSEFSRRTLLKRSSASMAGFTIAGNSRDFRFTSKLDENSERVGQVQLIETAIVYDGVPEGPEWPRAYMDDYVRYSIDESKSILFINQEVDNGGTKILKNNSIVARDKNKFVPFGRISPGREKSNILDTKLGYRCHVSQSVSLVEEHSPPKVVLVPGKDQDIRAIANGTEYRINPSKKSTIKLKDETVKIRRKSDSVREVNDPKNPEETTLVRERGSVESINVTPKLIVHNNGDLDVHKKK